MVVAAELPNADVMFAEVPVNELPRPYSGRFLGPLGFKGFISDSILFASSQVL